MKKNQQNFEYFYSNYQNATEQARNVEACRFFAFAKREDLDSFLEKEPNISLSVLKSAIFGSLRRRNDEVTPILFEVLEKNYPDNLSCEDIQAMFLLVNDVQNHFATRYLEQNYKATEVCISQDKHLNQCLSVEGIYQEPKKVKDSRPFYKDAYLLEINNYYEYTPVQYIVEYNSVILFRRLMEKAQTMNSEFAQHLFILSLERRRSSLINEALANEDFFNMIIKSPIVERYLQAHESDAKIKEIKALIDVVNLKDKLDNNLSKKIMQSRTKI